MIGANVPARTTLFNFLSKGLRAGRGDILFAGQSLRGIARYGIAAGQSAAPIRSPRPFGDLTVRENVAMPMMFRGKNRLPRPQALAAEATRFAIYAGLGDKAQRARRTALPLQQRKAVEFARGVTCPAAPPSGRMRCVWSHHPPEVRRFVASIREVRDVYGVTVIWVEPHLLALTQVSTDCCARARSIIADGFCRKSF